MLRHAYSGETSISGAKKFRAFLRNLNLADGPLASPNGSAVFESTFPIYSPSKDWLTSPCTEAQVRDVRFNDKEPFVAHVAEGTNDGAHLEIDCVLRAIARKTTPSVFIHSVAANDSDISRMKTQEISVDLSPRSNFQLYGQTAPILKLRAARINLALGTDWSVSGSLTELDEARCLARYNRDSLNNALSWADIHRMMTENGAKAVGLQKYIGKLAVGEYADMVILDTAGRRSLGAVLENSALKQTVAVFIGGKAASIPVAWDGKVPTLEHCEQDPRDLCGQQRTVCGLDPNNNLGKLLRQQLYTIDDAKMCSPLPTNDCVAR